jgi:glycosyltransferase involved in cell wall biosynthesis
LRKILNLSYHKDKAMRCDIVIPVWNMREITEQCVKSIIRNTRFPYRLIIVDNASDDETKQYLEDLRDKKEVDVHAGFRCGICLHT